MTLTIVVSAIALLAVILSATVIFRDYPDSAIDSARNTLFELRGELFEMGRSERLGFQSEAYGYSREMLNAMIRYAHDISFTQLLFAAFLHRDPLSRKYKEAIRAHRREVMSALHPSTRKDVDAIMDRATLALFQLVIVRSPVLTGALAIMIAFHTLSETLSTLLTNLKKTMHARKRQAKAHRRSPVEDAIGEILDNKPMRRVAPVINAEAARYFRPDPLGCLPQAA